MVASLITWGIDKYLKKGEQKEAIKALRVNVIDEVKINLNVLDRYFVAERKALDTDATQELKRKAIISLVQKDLDEVFSCGILYSKIFPEIINHQNALKTNNDRKIRQYVRWIEKDKTAADLLRRVRIRFAKIKQSTMDGEDLGDFGYLYFQLRTFLNSLDKSK